MAMLPIQVTVELLIGSTWVDISTFVYHRNPVTITGGKTASGDRQTPSVLTFTVNNRDGRFSPLYASGAYFPNLKRNVQIRVSATATSSSGNYFAGYRFWGEVTRWPPLSDISGHDVYVDVTAHGSLRRTREGGGQGSALDRYYQQLTGSFAPIAYWPCEEDPRFGGFIASDPGGSQIGTGLPNGQPMTVSAGTPTWKSNNSFNGSGAIPVLNGSTWDGLTGSFNSSGDDIYNVAGTYQWVASTTSVDARCWGGGGGGENGASGGGEGGGGGEFAQNTTLAVTPGTAYTVVVGSGGSGGNYNKNGGDNPGQNGRLSKMTGGGAVTVTAHGGLGGTAGVGGAGGTGSTAPVHHDGGAGAASGTAGGNGGGGSGGTAVAGNAGTASAGNTGGAGGVAVTGGGGGGRGGDAPNNNNAAGGHIPGGGGGGGSGVTVQAYAGQGGADGKVELVYTPQTTATTNVIRFVIQVPAHGGNPGKVLLRVKTGSAVLDHLDVTYEAGSKFRLQGFNAANAQQFDSTALSWAVDGNPLMVSVELKQNGTGVDWAFKTITPGAGVLRNSASGTKASASVGNVTEVIAAPNADITKTALGHISVQYALIDLRKVSRHLHGHHAELGIDRFIRLCNEQAMANVPEFNETKDHWAFEEGLQGWTAVNATPTRVTTTVGGTPWFGPANGVPADGSNFAASNALAAQLAEGDQFVSDKNPGQIFTVYNVGFPAFGFNRIDIRPMAKVIIDSADTVTQVVNAQAGVNDPLLVGTPWWPVYGAHSMLLTCNGAGQPSATGPTGTSGQPVSVGDIVSVAAHMYAPAGLPNAYVGIKWYTAAGAACAHAEDDGADVVIDAGDVVTLKAKFTAPATAAFFAPVAGDHHTDANNTLIYVDNVRVSPRMGPQTRKHLHKFMEEIEDLDQGILREYKHAWGHGYRTRFRLINQTPVVTLNYAQGMLSPPLAPVVDQQNTKNDITVRRERGSKRRISDDTGPVGTGEPPAGAGRKKRLHRVVAEEDAQLAALAQHLLNLGTVTDERYPTVTVDMLRCSIAGHPIAPLMSAIASVEIGDMIQMTNLPFWFPQATAKQLVIGYYEELGPYTWNITWNCQPESPWEIVATSQRRW